MKNTMMAMALLPLTALAQQKNNKAPEPLLKASVHYEQGLVTKYVHLKVKGVPTKTQTKVEGDGYLNFARGEKEQGYKKRYTAMEHPEYDYGKMVAQQVEISSSGFPDMKADSLVYDMLSEKAILAGHVRISGHGTDMPLCNVAYLDLADDNMRIEGMR